MKEKIMSKNKQIVGKYLFLFGGGRKETENLSVNVKFLR